MKLDRKDTRAKRNQSSMHDMNALIDRLRSRQESAKQKPSEPAPTTDEACRAYRPNQGKRIPEPLGIRPPETLEHAVVVLMSILTTRMLQSTLRAIVEGIGVASAEVSKGGDIAGFTMAAIDGHMGGGGRTKRHAGGHR